MSRTFFGFFWAHKGAVGGVTLEHTLTCCIANANVLLVAINNNFSDITPQYQYLGVFPPGNPDSPSPELKRMGHIVDCSKLPQFAEGNPHLLYNENQLSKGHYNDNCQFGSSWSEKLEDAQLLAWGYFHQLYASSWEITHLWRWLWILPSTLVPDLPLAFHIL